MIRTLQCILTVAVILTLVPVAMAEEKKGPIAEINIRVIYAVKNKVKSVAPEIEDDIEREEQQREEQKEYEAELAYQAEHRINALTQLYLVERGCGGEDAMGGGCGAWYVETIREAVDGDRMIRRDSPDSERDFSSHSHRIVANWHRADGYTAIDGGNFVCSGCRRVEW